MTELWAVTNVKDSKSCVEYEDVETIRLGVDKFLSKNNKFQQMKDFKTRIRKGKSFIVSDFISEEVKRKLGVL